MFYNAFNQQCIIQLTFINLHPDEYTQRLCYYSFVVNLDRCVGSCNTLDDLSNKEFVPNKTEDLNIHVLRLQECDSRNKWIKGFNKFLTYILWM